jgi:hypothetical protein
VPKLPCYRHAEAAPEFLGNRAILHHRSWTGRGVLGTIGAPMLSSLLPGFREVRAPLAAGFLWLAALWLLLEPRWARGSDAEGVVGSVNRLMGMLSLVGQGVVLSFAAYIVGSLSVFLFSRPLLSLIRTSIERHRGSLDGLSDLGRVSLTRVAADGRQRLEQALALSGVGVDEVLGLVAQVPDTSDKRMVIRRRRRPAEPIQLSSDTVWRKPEERQEHEIAARVLRDLPVVANAQLLGQEPEVFAAVDRSQAEVEFRVALVSALLALAVAVALAALPENPLTAALAVLIGVLGAGSLILDAARRRRDSNELVLSLMEHGRITPPSLLRAESTASELADQAPAKVVGRQGEETARRIRQYLASLDAVPSSGSMPMLTQALEAAAGAHAEAPRLDGLLNQYSPGSEARLAETVLEPLDRALCGWAELNAGLWQGEEHFAGVRIVEGQWHLPRFDWPEGGPSPEELVRLVGEGRERHRKMIDQVRTAVTQIATSDAARTAAPEAT